MEGAARRIHAEAEREGPEGTQGCVATLLLPGQDARRLDAGAAPLEAACRGAGRPAQPCERRTRGAGPNPTTAGPMNPAGNPPRANPSAGMAGTETLPAGERAVKIKVNPQQF